MEAFVNRLRKRHRHLKKWAKRENIRAFRVYDRDIPEFAFAVDLYDTAAVAQAFATRRRDLEDPSGGYLDEAAEAVAEGLEIPVESVFMKVRRRQKGASQYERFARKREERWIEEYGLKYRVNLSDYLDTGLFLDHRPTRQWVRGAAGDRRVLNLFAYTGAFSVAAASGGARSVHTLDISNTYLDWARANLEANSTHATRLEFTRADALDWLSHPPSSNETYDLIILDPPSFSNSKRMNDTLDIRRDHPALIRRTAARLAPGGELLFSTNRRGFSPDTENLKEFELSDITKETTSPDFASRPAHRSYLIRRA